MRRRRASPPGPFLEEHAQVSVRFQEVDALGVVWHGHYLSYFEIGRVAFGQRYELGYQTILDHGYIAPIVSSAVDHVLPARFGDVLTVRTRLHAEPGARILFHYLVTNARGEELAAGHTVQAFTDLGGELVLARPDFFEAWLARWEGELRSA